MLGKRFIVIYALHVLLAKLYKHLVHVSSLLRANLVVLHPLLACEVFCCLVLHHALALKVRLRAYQGKVCVC